MSVLPGDPVKPPCPSCGGQAVYNGNYFCADTDGCGWALPAGLYGGDDEPNTNEMARWGLGAYLSLMAYRKQEPNPSAMTIEAWR